MPSRGPGRGGAIVGVTSVVPVAEEDDDKELALAISAPGAVADSLEKPAAGHALVPVAAADAEDRLEIVVFQESCAPTGMIRPYCGAELTSAYPVQDTRLGDGMVHGKPIPAWTDAGMASHMRGLCGLTPGVAPWRSCASSAPEDLQPRFSLKVFGFRILLVSTSVVENVCCWLTYFEIKDPKSNFYNKFEAYSMGLPGLDWALAVLALVNTAYLFIFWTLVAVVRLDLHRMLAHCRLMLSLGCGIVCLIAVFFSESTKVFPFVCTLSSILHLKALAIGGLLPRQGLEPSRGQRRCSYFLLVLLSIIALTWCAMFGFDSMVFLREDQCRATKNRAMPVRVSGISQWQCVKWGEPHHIARPPLSSDSNVFKAECTTPFHAFDEAVGEDALRSAGGATANLSSLWTPSRRSHFVLCPPSCQAFGLGREVLGCRVYDARAPICAAAVQMGVISSDEGGMVTVVGRAPPESYDRCNLNGVVSLRSADEAPSPLAGQSLVASRPSELLPASSLLEEGAEQGELLNGRNVTLEGAFYFQVPETAEHDFVTLHDFRQVSTPGAKAPYRSYVADVSWRVGGGQLHREEVQLGPSPTAEVEVNFCHDGGPAPNMCE